MTSNKYRKQNRAKVLQKIAAAREKRKPGKTIIASGPERRKAGVMSESELLSRGETDTAGRGNETGGW